MARKGRPSGSTSRYCLIKDQIIFPYEIHVDESTSTFLKVISESQKTVGYYAHFHIYLEVYYVKNMYHREKMVEYII